MLMSWYPRGNYVEAADALTKYRILVCRLCLGKGVYYRPISGTLYYREYDPCPNCRGVGTRRVQSVDTNGLF
jgi:hypothetical protein